MCHGVVMAYAQVRSGCLRVVPTVRAGLTWRVLATVTAMPTGLVADEFSRDEDLTMMRNVQWSGDGRSGPAGSAGAAAAAATTGATAMVAARRSRIRADCAVT
jgi:hypothetical protein